MTTTDTGVAYDDGELSAADALLSRFMPNGDPDAPPKKKAPSEEGETPKSDDPPKPQDDEETSEETPEEAEESEEEEQPQKKYADDDDQTYVKVKMGDEEHEVPVKDLKRLWGQEQSLTRKSQEVAEQRKKAEAETTKAVVGINKLLERAKARFEPYGKIDFLVAAQQLAPDELSALRKEALAAYEDVQFLEGELNGIVTEATKKQQADQAVQAKACVQSLSDPESQFHIENWGDKVYDETRTFAVEHGLSKDIVNALVDPAAIKLLHMAMQYERGKSKVLTTKVNKTPKKIIKSTRSIPSDGGKGAKADKAMTRLARTGTTDDAAEALLARWSANSDD